MRITEIEIKNFKAFYGTYQIDLRKTGRNLLVYGENGSGKSSLYFALKLFLESGDNPSHRFENDQNRFITDAAGHIKLGFRANRWSKQETYEWSESVRETNDELIIEASRTKGFLDYKSLLETHYVHRESNTVNVFNLLVKTLLANTVNIEGRRLADDWSDIQSPYPRRNATSQIATLEERIESFNIELANRLAELQPKASEILGKFGHNVELNFDFPGVKYDDKTKKLDNQQILLTVDLSGRNIPRHHLFLNEARLSAIAIAIYFSSILIQPESRLKVLALDDVLIGLDMSNRLPVLDILDEYFPEHQIFLTTYDKAWYEIVKQRPSNGNWKCAEFYSRKIDKCEIPIYVENKAYLEKAEDYFDACDYKACVIYLRTAFEVAIKKFCDKKHVRVRYCENPKDLTSEDFWEPIKTGTLRDGTPFLEQSLIDEIKLYRSIILNPLSHSRITPEIKKEISDAIKAVETLEIKLKEHYTRGGDQSSTS